LRDDRVTDFCHEFVTQQWDRCHVAPIESGDVTALGRPRKSLRLIDDKEVACTRRPPWRVRDRLLQLVGWHCAGCWRAERAAAGAANQGGMPPG
jgi:hypothetical protein